MTALRLENISHRASTICGPNCLQIMVTNHILGTSVLQIPTTENLSLRRLLRYWLLGCCFLRYYLSLCFIGLSLLALASSSGYLYLGSFMWLTVKIGALFSGSNTCPLPFSSLCFYPIQPLPILFLPILLNIATVQHYSHCYMYGWSGVGDSDRDRSSLDLDEVGVPELYMEESCVLFVRWWGDT